jgi:alpha-amylase/alpha-mannosidase (GH57 family)
LDQSKSFAILGYGEIMLKKPLCVAFLWHMHQPDYRETQTSEVYLPWTRLHAVKDYYDMAAHVERAGNVHVTINLVPSLLDQLEAYSSGKVNEVQATLTLQDAATLDPREKAFLLRTFFQLSPVHMLRPYPRYMELYERRGMADDRGEFSAGLSLYTTQDYRDLQLWYNLAWCGPELRKNPEIAGLLEKGRGFSEEDKRGLLEIQCAFIGRILPYYRRLAESRAVEFSISPYYHPILPLLCDLRTARESLPSIDLPADSYVYPQDAKEHIHRALENYSRNFGHSAQGMWPSEGALSDAALALARDAGLRWLASDENVLWNSLSREGRVHKLLSPERKYAAYRWGGDDCGPCLFFRDHTLSDLFGFSYCHWDPAAAVSDFMGRLRAIHQSLPDDGRCYVVPIILDGENAWEHYPGNGAEFLQALYQQLANSSDVRTVTFAEYLELEPFREPLPSIVSGSWIYGNLATWIGHPEKNRAWELMAAARRTLSSAQLQDANARSVEAALREMMIAEGSDWLWWFGDDHPTENAAEFDSLFRSRLKNVYMLLGEVPPADLHEPIKKAQPKTRHKNPTHTMTPQLDGIVSDYYEWISAGCAVPGGGESMHRTDRLLEKIYFGFDLRSLYLRIDLAAGAISNFPLTAAIQIRFTFPRKCSVALERTEQKGWHCTLTDWPAPDRIPAIAADRILELDFPLDALGLQKADDVTFSILIMENSHERERFPSTGSLTVTVDPWGLDQQEWIV